MATKKKTDETKVVETVDVETVVEETKNKNATKKTSTSTKKSTTKTKVEKEEEKKIDERVDVKNDEKKTYHIFNSKSPVSLAFADCIKAGMKIKEKYADEIASSIDERTNKVFLPTEMLIKIFNSEEVASLNDIIEVYYWRMSMRKKFANLKSNVSRLKTLSPEIKKAISVCGNEITMSRKNDTFDELVGKIVKFPKTRTLSLITNLTYICRLVDVKTDLSDVKEIEIQRNNHTVVIGGKFYELPTIMFYNKENNEYILQILPTISVIDINEIEKDEEGNDKIMEKSFNFSEIEILEVYPNTLRTAILDTIVGLV